jgi:tetratricopeptide (TPR) repeat protein
MNTSQKNVSRSLSVPPGSDVDREPLENRFNAPEISRSYSPAVKSAYKTENSEPRRALLAGTLPLFQCAGVAWFLSVFFPLTCGPLVVIETVSFGLILLAFMAYNLSTSVGRRALNAVLFIVAIGFPFVIYYAVTHESQNQSQADHYYEIGQYQRAIDAYRADDANEIAGGKNWLKYGDCYFKLGQYQKAVESYKKASELQSEKVELERLPRKFGRSYLQEEQQSLAAVHFRLAKAYAKTGNKKQAQIYFKKAQEQGYKAATWLKEMQQAAATDKRIHTSKI